ncbi:MAG TPA: deoxyguanosinetriphosphate triphosphohydrolase, partial [Anaerovoracaceae bacterium]|nr:deoxyguanosinetriphosphate triphosphohydrolase [Anaerovoracaceae bacterium]
MLRREQLEQLEYERLSSYAAKSAESKGRILPEEPCTLRTDYQRDRDRIIHSKSLRRLMHKT